MNRSFSDFIRTEVGHHCTPQVLTPNAVRILLRGALTAPLLHITLRGVYHAALFKEKGL